MCVHIYYAYSILSNLQESLETLVKIKLGYSYSSSYNCFGFQTHREKNCTHTYKHISMHTYTHTQKKLLAYAYEHNYSHKIIIITFHVKICSNTIKTYIHKLILQCKRRKQRFAKKSQLSAKSSTQFINFFHL